MNSILNYSKGLYLARFTCNRAIISVFIGALIFTGIQIPVQAQNSMFERSSWWFGPAGGANFNLYHGSTQAVNSGLSISANFQNTKEMEPFAFPVLEFHRPDTRLGFILNVGYDNRSGSFNPTFTTKLSYLTVEPSIRINFFRSPFYLFSGPRIAFNVDQRFNYQPDLNSAVTGGTFDNMNKYVISMQAGFGYDLPLTAKSKKNQLILAPFVSFHPYFGQNPRTIESWNLTTIRAGIALKFGSSHKKIVPEQVEVPVVIAVEPEARFMVNDSLNIPAEPVSNEVFPLQNYIYYNLKTDEKLSPEENQRKEAKEDQKIISSLSNLSDSSFRRLIVHDNFLSRLGDQMAKNRSNTITLIGASKDGVKDGQKMAESIKTFLTAIYGIDASNIVVKTRRKVNIHSELHPRKKEIALLQERVRKVLIKSKSSNLQQEFRGADGAPIKPLKMISVAEADEYSYVTFKTEGAKEPFSSWFLKITDDQGKVFSLGPYHKDLVSISGKSILGNRTSGKYEISMIGIMSSGVTVKKDTIAYLVHRPLTASEDKAKRYKILYEYNNSKAIGLYTRYLTEVVTPNIPNAGKVVINGHSENVGGREYSPELFLSQANDTRKILENALAKAGRTDVQIEVYGFDKDQIIAPFKKASQLDNLSNRTVIIDIISKK